MKKFIVMILSAILFSGCSEEQGSSPGDQGAGRAQINLKIAHMSPETDSIHQGFVKFKELVEAENIGLTVDIYHSGQITNSDRDAVEGIKHGEIDLSSVAAEHLATHVKEFYVLNANYLFSSMEEVKSALEGPKGDFLRNAVLDKQVGLRVACFWGGSVRGFWNNIRPVRTLADYKGLKVRVSENPINIAEMEALGAIPTPMAWGELYAGLQQGTVNGIPGNIAGYIQQGLVEVLDYWSDTNHSFYIPVAIMSQSTYEKFDNEQKRAFDKAFGLARDHQWELAFKETDDMVKKMAELKNQGVAEIIRLTDNEREAIKKVYIETTEPLVAELCGEKVLNEFRQ